MYIVETLTRGSSPLIGLRMFEDPAKARDFYYAQHPYYDVVTLWIDDVWVLRHTRKRDKTIIKRRKTKC